MSQSKTRAPLTQKFSYSVRWKKKHQNNLVKYFVDLFAKGRFLDVTLMAADGKRVRAHRIILSAYSTYFDDLFLLHPGNNTIVLLSGVSFEDLQAILDFMYKGEAEIKKENIKSFFNTAESLQVRGLIRDQIPNDTQTTSPNCKLPKRQLESDQNNNGTPSRKRPNTARPVSIDSNENLSKRPNLAPQGVGSYEECVHEDKSLRINHEEICVPQPAMAESASQGAWNHGSETFLTCEAKPNEEYLHSLQQRSATDGPTLRSGTTPEAAHAEVLCTASAQPAHFEQVNLELAAQATMCHDLTGLCLKLACPHCFRCYIKWHKTLQKHLHFRCDKAPSSECHLLQSGSQGPPPCQLGAPVSVDATTNFSPLSEPVTATGPLKANAALAELTRTTSTHPPKSKRINAKSLLLSSAGHDLSEVSGCSPVSAFSCPVCGALFVHEQFLQRHIACHHSLPEA